MGQLQQIAQRHVREMLKEVIVDATASCRMALLSVECSVRRRRGRRPRQRPQQQQQQQQRLVETLTQNHTNATRNKNIPVYIEHIVSQLYQQLYIISRNCSWFIIDSVWILVIDHANLRFPHDFTMSHPHMIKPTPIPVSLLGRSCHPPGMVPSGAPNCQTSIPLSIGKLVYSRYWAYTYTVYTYKYVWFMNMNIYILHILLQYIQTPTIGLLTLPDCRVRKKSFDHSYGFHWDSSHWKIHEY